MLSTTHRVPVRWSARTPGMPVRMERLRFMSADASAAGTDGAGAAADDAAPQAAAQAAQAAAAAPTAQGTDEPWADPTKARAEIERLRRENGAERTNAKTKAADEARAELAQTLGRALGLIADGDAAPDPAQLTAQAEQARAETRAALVELEVYRTAAKHGGDPVALTDSRSFLAKVADLDPADAEFSTKVTAAAKDAVTANAQLRAQVASGASSVDHAGGTGESHDPAMNARPGQARLAAAYAANG